MKMTLATYPIPLPQHGGHAKKKATAQHYWKGGTLGAPHDWLLPDNWLNGHVPGWKEIVVIPYAPFGEGHFPVIDHFVSDIAKLVIGPKARLVIGKQGRLTVDGLGKHGTGILNEGELIVLGELTICRTKSSNIRNDGFIQNSGSIAFDQPLEKGQWEGAGEELFLGKSNIWL